MRLQRPPPDVLPLGVEPPTLEALNETFRAAKPYVTGGTRAVLGEGPIGARLALVGEQPGEQEDLEGRPFVDPAGQLLDRALAEAGIERGDCYVTNAVKHFKFVQRGKRRIHQKPTAGEVRRAVRESFALSVEDVLARRSRVLFLDAALAAAAAPAVSRILARELNWPPAREAAEIAAFGALAARYLPRSATEASSPPSG